MSGSSEFPPETIKGILGEVTALLKERGETVSVGETVSSFLLLDLVIWSRSGEGSGDCIDVHADSKGGAGSRRDYFSEYLEYAWC